MERGRIAYVGSEQRAPTGFLTDFGDAVIVPGLVNTHTHLDLTMLRGLLDGLPFFSWVRTLTAARRDVLSDTDLLDSARLGIREGLLAGITTYADTAPNDAPFQAILELGVRGTAYREVFGPDPAQRETSLAELRDAVSAMRARETPMVRVGVSPHAPYSVSDELYVAVAAFAREAQLPVATHIAESADESRLVENSGGPFADLLRSRGITVEKRARSPIALLEKCGVLDVDPLLIHCVRANAEDVALIGQRRLAVAHCPASNTRLGHGRAPLEALAEAGARIGLGSDSMASNDAMNILAEAALAMNTPVSADRTRLTAQAVLRLATLGGASALGLASEIGSLDAGKQADLAVFPLPRKAVTPVDPALALLATPAPATMVMVAGQVLVREGRLTKPDDGLDDRASSISDRLASWKRT